MTNSIDYLISAVRYNFEHTRIVDVKRHLYQGDSVAAANIVNRNIIADDLKKGLKYKTIHRCDDNTWELRKDVLLIMNSGYITVDPNSTRDNLGNIQDF